MNKNKVFLSVFIALCMGLGLYSCSQESNTFVSKAWHNTTARYNAYFLAKERLIVIEQKIWDVQKDDYNRLLEIFPLVDSNFSKSLKSDLDYCFERASIPPTKHKNSNWVDDSYVLIGKLKLYETKYDSAGFAFKYVNTTGKDDQMRYLALTWLLRTYILNGEMKFANDIHTYLEAQDLSLKVKREYYLASAQHYRVKGDLVSCLSELKKAVPLIRDKDYRARIHFLIGQLHQKFNQPDSAYHHYSMVLKKNPPYDLGFFAQLNMSQVSSPTEADEIKRIRKFFAKMLKDLKNEEFKDRIYYDMAQFELKQGNRDTSITNLNKSLRVEGGVTPYMKAYSYLSLGRIYYNHPTMPKLNKYTKAKLYYDSTVAEMDSSFENYSAIIERSKTLADFVTQIETIQREDSLQQLAKMDASSLSAFLDEVKTQEEIRLKEEAKKELERQERLKKEAKKQEQQANSSFFDPTATASTKFMFYNPDELAMSFQKFTKKWGERPLEDNWRRSVKELAIATIVEQSKDTILDTLAKIDEDSLLAAKKLEIENITVDKEGLYKDIPLSPEALEISNLKLQEAFYRLGKIYDLNLNETDNAITTFQELQTRFPKHDHYEEVYYFLYILCGKSAICNSDEYKNLLLNNFPNSLYAKLVLNPNYVTETKIADKKVHQLYEQAFNHYTRSEYIVAHNEVNAIISNYPHNDIMDKLEFLKILTYAKTDKLTLYVNSLESFIENNRKSSIIPYAKELLEEANKQDFKSAAAIVDTNFYLHQDTTHYFIAYFQKRDISYKDNLLIFNEFKNTYFRDSTYTARMVDFDSSHYLIVVKSFTTKGSGKKYLDKLAHWNEFSGHYKNMMYNYYIIDEKNYATLLANREIERYRLFYKKHYK